MTDMQVAETIRQQLGGNQFCAMVGAHIFTGTDNSLSFHIKAQAKNGVKMCRVELMPSDTYDITFYGWNSRLVEKIEGAYAENLQRIFKRVTGLDTHL